MEKRAVVEIGRTPSEVSGKKSTMLKNGTALATGESSTQHEAEAKLAKKMNDLYNRHGTP